MNNKRIVCWVGDAPNHRALVCKVASTYNVTGIIIDRKRSLKSNDNFINKVLNKIFFSKIDKAWHSLQKKYEEQFAQWPEIEKLYVNTINANEAFEFTKKLQPDLIVVSGTSLIKEPMVSIAVPIGIVNLHTGLSPYIKGGPNCTNWCIANNQWSLIGSTILWLSAGIDSGNIILSERVDVSGFKDLDEIHFKVMEHAHELYLRAIDYILSASSPYQSIPQRSLGKGNLYLTKMWTTAQKRKLLKNLSGNRNNVLPAEVKTIPLPL